VALNVSLLLQVHPIAAGAWLFVSSAYQVGDLINRIQKYHIPLQVIKAQQDKDNAIRDLYKTMMATLKAASKEDILKRREEFEGHFEDMINISIECSLFIAGYSSGRYYRKLALETIGMIIIDIDIYL
jgi:hypothetical protein